MKKSASIKTQVAGRRQEQQQQQMSFEIKMNFFLMILPPIIVVDVDVYYMVA